MFDYLIVGAGFAGSTLAERLASQLNKKVLLIEYPSRGIYRIALQTADRAPEVSNVLGRDMLTVFVPTTPNATSGFLAFVPRESAIELSMSVEEALKMIVSLGVVVPEWRADPAPPPLARP